jgi:hypothetical protein
VQLWPFRAAPSLLAGIDVAVAAVGQQSCRQIWQVSPFKDCRSIAARELERAGRAAPVARAVLPSSQTSPA